jgi:hypothetical protein
MRATQVRNHVLIVRGDRIASVNHLTELLCLFSNFWDIVRDQQGLKRENSHSREKIGLSETNMCVLEQGNLDQD